MPVQLFLASITAQSRADPAGLRVAGFECENIGVNVEKTGAVDIALAFGGFAGLAVKRDQCAGIAALMGSQQPLMQGIGAHLRGGIGGHGVQPAPAN